MFSTLFVLNKSGLIAHERLRRWCGRQLVKLNGFLVSTIPKASRFALLMLRSKKREEMVTTGTFLGSGTKE